MALTYRMLLKKLQGLHPDRLDDNVTIYVNTQDEYVPVQSAGIASEHNDVLDQGHFFLRTQ